MVRTYALSPLAEADLEAIWIYTAQEWSVDQAEAYTGDIIDVFEDIATGKKQGRRSGGREGYLSTLVGRHAIYFQIRGDVVAVIRILHQNMDVERHL
ncbi:MAG: type II toxin-antitoxin system RelE/ParE family toxin [Albidovulum sp.]